MKSLLIGFLCLFSLTSFALEQVITCSKKGKDFYFINLKIDIDSRKIVENSMDLEFQGRWLTPGHYKGQSIEDNNHDQYGTMSIYQKNGAVFLLGNYYSVSTDNNHTYGMSFPVSIFAKRAKRGSFKVSFLSDYSQVAIEDVDGMMEDLSDRDMISCSSELK